MPRTGKLESGRAAGRVAKTERERERKRREDFSPLDMREVGRREWKKGEGKSHGKFLEREGRCSRE